VLTGEAGMGKSILLGRLAGLARQRGFLVVGAHHRRAGAEGIRDVFRQWLTELALVTPTEQIPWEELVTECGLPEHIATMIMRWSSGETDAVFGRGSAQAMPGAEFNADEAIAGAFRQLFGAMTFKQPCVLIIDQIEAYDDGMARFFEDWAAFCKSSNVMFVAALQTIAGAEPPRLPGEAVHLSIAPFDDEIAMHFIESRLPWQASRPVLERLVEIAGGIPLYLEQLTIQLAGKQFDDVVGLNAWFGEVKGLGGALQLRLYAQPNNVRNVLGLLAVLGSGARARWVDKLASKSWEVDRALQKLYDEDLIKVRGPEARLYFDPLIFEKIVYEQLSGAQRLRVHGMAANFFIEQAQATSDPELLREYRCELIEHLARCGEFEAAREASHDLARDCLARFEYGPARQYLRKTLGLGMKVPGFSKVDRARLQLELSRIERVQGHVREAVDLVGPVHRDADLPALIRDEAALDLAELWLDSEDTGRVETLARRATDDIRARLASGTTTGGDDWLLVRALKVLGEILEKQARFPAAAQVLIEAVELNASQDVSAVHDPWRIRLLWEPLNQLGRLQLRMGRGAGAEKYLQQALALANRLGDVQGEIAARGNLASMYASTERLDQAYEILGEAKAIAGHAGDLKSICRLDYNLGLLYASQHRWEDARDVFTSSKKLASSLGWREGIALSLSQLRGVERALA
ncbi:MAG: tetratricopeptide repeat protein, partial [Bradymonadaceae bacterium]